MFPHTYFLVYATWKILLDTCNKILVTLSGYLILMINFSLLTYTFPLIPVLTLSALGGTGPSIVWGGSIWPALFNSSPGNYWAIILSILIIILFKERINDYVEIKLGQYLENLPRHCNFCLPRIFLKNFEDFIFSNFKSSLLGHFLRYQALNFS